MILASRQKFSLQRRPTEFYLYSLGAILKIFCGGYLLMKRFLPRRVKSVIRVLRLLLSKRDSMPAIGIINFLRYDSVDPGKIVCLSIEGRTIWVRKGTPDLDVALSCLKFGEFRDCLNYLERSFEGVIIDAGGYIGTAALALSDLFPRATIITIEPDRDNFQLLCRNTEYNSRITPVEAALVGLQKQLVSVKDRGTGEWGYTVVVSPLDNPCAREIRQVRAVTLSELGIDLTKVGLLKLDIEGGERDLFMNDADNLRKLSVVFVELHDRIVAGCTESFNEFSRGRRVEVSSGGKYFSIKQSLPGPRYL